ncbi:AAA family ATPase [bacterium]|nr:AAA family ATPase [bacterium]
MDKKINIFIIDKDEKSSAIIDYYLKEIAYDFKIFKAVSLIDVENLIDNDCLNIFIIDISDNIDENINKISTIEKNNKNCRFIITSYNLKTDYIIKLLRSSKKDFIEKPIIRNNLINTVNEIINKMTSEQDYSGQGKIISVFSNKGGLGKTTISVNLAMELGNQNKQEKIALIDMNMFLGDVTTFLDINPPYDLYSIAQKAENNKNIVNFTAQYEQTNLFVVADSPYRDFSTNIDKNLIIQLFNSLRKNFKYIIVDCSSAITEKVKYLFDFSDLVLLISEANLPTLKNCKKCLNFFEKIDIKNKVELILNRYSEDDECSIDDIENVLRKEILTVIPNDWYSITDSINKGLTLGECYPNTAVYDAYIELSELVMDKLCR